MPTAGRVAETLIYSLLNLLPYLILALYPFYNTLRFSRRATVACYCGADAGADRAGRLRDAVFHRVRGALVAAEHGALRRVFSAVRQGQVRQDRLYAADGFQCSQHGRDAVQSVGKSALSGIGGAGLPVELSLCTALVQAATFPLLFLYFRRYFCGALRVKSSEKAWRYLWLVPGTFYFCWYFMLYFNPLSSHEMALMPENAVFTALLNLGRCWSIRWWRMLWCRQTAMWRFRRKTTR